MTSATRRRLWLAAKLLLAAAVVAGVGWHFAGVLSAPELHPYPFALRVEYLLPAGLLYLLGHCFWAAFWVRLLHNLGVPVGWGAGVRAYFVSQFGKYVPGKVFVVLLRVEMLRGVPGGRPLVVGATAAYETLTSMATGALLGVLLLPRLGVLPPQVGDNLAVIAAVAGLPVALALLNKLAARRAGGTLPNPPLWLLLQGFVHGAAGWAMMAVSLALTVRAVAPEPPPWADEPLLADLGAVALAYAVGFAALFIPGGLGLRELILQAFLTPRFGDDRRAEAEAVVVALVLRLTWTVAELLLALALYARRPRTPTSTPP